MEGDPSYPSLDHEYLIHTFDLDKVVVEGTTSGIEYMAFVQEGMLSINPRGLTEFDPLLWIEEVFFVFWHDHFFVPGVDPKVLVGLRAEFGCPDEYVLNGNYYREPIVQVTCAENGTFGSPNWQTCVSGMAWHGLGIKLHCNKVKERTRKSTCRNNAI